MFFVVYYYYFFNIGNPHFFLLNGFTVFCVAKAPKGFSCCLGGWVCYVCVSRRILHRVDFWGGGIHPHRTTQGGWSDAGPPQGWAGVRGTPRHRIPGSLRGIPFTGIKLCFCAYQTLSFQPLSIPAVAQGPGPVLPRSV